MSRGKWQDQTGESDMSAPPQTKAEVEANKKNPDKMIDKIPGDKGSTVDKIRKANQKRKEAMEE